LDSGRRSGRVEKRVKEVLGGRECFRRRCGGREVASRLVQLADSGKGGGEMRRLREGIDGTDLGVLVERN
jgi:hypothetical protein